MTKIAGKLEIQKSCNFIPTGNSHLQEKNHKFFYKEEDFWEERKIKIQGEDDQRGRKRIEFMLVSLAVAYLLS